MSILKVSELWVNLSRSSKTASKSFRVINETLLLSGRIQDLNTGYQSNSDDDMNIIPLRDTVAGEALSMLSTYVVKGEICVERVVI